MTRPPASVRNLAVQKPTFPKPCMMNDLPSTCVMIRETRMWLEPSKLSVLHTQGYYENTKAQMDCYMVHANLHHNTNAYIDWYTGTFKQDQIDEYTQRNVREQSRNSAEPRLLPTRLLGFRMAHSHPHTRTHYTSVHHLSTHSRRKASPSVDLRVTQELSNTEEHAQSRGFKASGYAPETLRLASHTCEPIHVVVRKQRHVRVRNPAHFTRARAQIRCHHIISDSCERVRHLGREGRKQARNE
jgi:hypothetical protein